MDDPVANKSTDQTAQEGAAQSTDVLSRRRLLKGAMAVPPAVFTLQSGAARAAISNVQCLENLPKFDKKKTYVDEATFRNEKPNWVREKVDGHVVSNQFGDYSGRKQTKILVETKRAGLWVEYQDENGKKWVAQNVDYGVSGYVRKKHYNNMKLWNSNSYFYKKNFFTKGLAPPVPRYKVKYVSVDQHGDYQHTGYNSKSPVTVSCWTSFTSPKSGGSGYWRG